jgi:hypothetical protein
MAASDAKCICLGIGKAVVILLSSVGTVVYLAWIGVKKGPMK